MDKEKEKGCIRAAIMYRILQMQGELAKQVLAVADIREMIEECEDDSDLALLKKALDNLIDSINHLQSIQYANTRKLVKS